MNIQANIGKIRAQFPMLQDCCYLNAASHAPPFLPMREAMDRFIADKFANDELHWEQWLEDTELAKEDFSRLVNGHGRGSVNFGFNVSQNINNILSSLHGDKRDELLFGDGEFPAVLFPLKRMEANHGVKLVKAGEQGLVTVEDLEERITERTKALVISHIPFCSGARLDLEEVGKLCEERDVHFIVDAAQSLGAVDIDVKRTKLDYITSTGAKWQLGFYGVCPFYVSPRLQESLAFPVSGWMSKKGMMDFDYVYKADSMDYRPLMWGDARDLNTGTPNLIAVFGFWPCLKLFLEMGMEQVEERVTGFSGILLDELGDSILHADQLRERRGGMVIYRFCSPEEEAEAKKRFQEEGIHVTFRFGGIRIAPHFYNTESEVNRIVEILQQLRKRYKG